MSFNSLETQTRNEQEDRYKKALAGLRPAGSGNNTHSSLLGVANWAVRAGVTEAQFLTDTRQHLPRGERDVPDSEILGAYHKAAQDGGVLPDMVVPTPPRIRPELLQALIRLGAGATIEAIRGVSPVPIPDDPIAQQMLVLNSLYGVSETVFVGERIGSNVATVGQVLEHLKHDIAVGPHIIPNPLTGEQGLTKDGKPSYRADSCVAAYRFAVVEFDNLPLEDQLAFWASVKLPVALLVHSGGKSIHGWVRVDQPDRDAWDRNVERELFAGRLTPLGADPSCRNEARLSRMPGFTRPDSEKLQQLIYLAPEGKAVEL